MGTDIHLHVELKINGRWEHYCSPNISRDYNLFAKMANVRNEDREINPISIPKGLPNDLSVITSYDFLTNWEKDAHSISWFSFKEICELEKYLNDNGTYLDTLFKCYLFGNAFDHLPKGVEDMRFVFWFDN